jgi:hypothetical protein
MNQRIRELHGQCKVCDKDTVLYFDYEKFAKLIIQDCIEINKQELSFTAFERLMNKYHDLLLNENQNKD